MGRGSAVHSALFLCPHRRQGQVIPHGSAVSYKFGFFPFTWHTLLLLIPGEGLGATVENDPLNILSWRLFYTVHICFAFSTLPHDALHDLNFSLSICNLASCSALLLAAITRDGRPSAADGSGKQRRRRVGLGGSLKGGGEM